MPRKGFVPRREVTTDSVYGSDLVQKFINSMMWDGKRSTAQRIFYGAMEQIGQKTNGDPLPTFDCHCPLLSLPRVFKTNLATIPSAMPYLSVPAEASAAWAERIATAPGLRVGVVWSGSMVGVIDRRPIDLRLLQPLWEVPEALTAWQLDRARVQPQSRQLLVLLSAPRR